MSAVWMPSSSVLSHALRTFSATSGIPRCTSIMIAPPSKPDGLAMPCPEMSGAEPWMASNMAKSSPMLDEPPNPTDPATSAAMSEMMSPYRLSVTITSKRSGRAATRALPMSMILWSASMSGYSFATSSNTWWKRPSACFMMLSLVMHVTFLRPYCLAYSKA